MKLGFYNHNLRCTAFNYYNICTTCTNDSLPFNVAKKDFEFITFRIQNTNDTVFNALMVWMGTGCIYYPFNDCFDTLACYHTTPFTPTTNHVQKPDTIDYFNAGGGKTNDSTFIIHADSAWYAIDSLLVTNQFAAYDFKVGIFSYYRSTGGYNTPPDWIVFLYYNPQITDVSLAESQNNELKVFPNPAVNRMTLESNMLMSGGSVSVFDIRGQLVLEQLISNNYTQTNLEFNVSSLSAGAYFIRLKSDKGIATSRFLKE